jgi:hypothetical protein
MSGPVLRVLREFAMRKFLFALVSFVVVTVAAPSGAAVMNFTGALDIRIGLSIPPGRLVGSGTATLQQTAGGKITQLTIPPSFLSDRTFLPVPNAFPIIQVVLTGVGGGSPGGGNPLLNSSIMLTYGNTCDAGHLAPYPPATIHVTGSGTQMQVPGKLRGIRCPGGKLAGFGGLDGSAFVGIFFAPVSAHTTFSSTFPTATLLHTAASSTTAGLQTGHGPGSQETFPGGFPIPIQNLEVPLTKVGVGSMITTTGGGIRVTVSAAGWTTGTATIYNATVKVKVHLPLTTHIPGSNSFTASQDVTTDTGTTETFMGFQGTTGMGKLQIQLVSPVLVLNNATDEYSNTTVKLTLTQAPEPGATALFFGGIGAVSLLYGVRRRRK